MTDVTKTIPDLVEQMITEAKAKGMSRLTTSYAIQWVTTRRPGASSKNIRHYLRMLAENHPQVPLAGKDRKHLLRKIDESTYAPL